MNHMKHYEAVVLKVSQLKMISIHHCGDETLSCDGHAVLAGLAHPGVVTHFRDDQ